MISIEPPVARLRLDRSRIDREIAQRVCAISVLRSTKISINLLTTERTENTEINLLNTGYFQGNIQTGVLVENLFRNLFRCAALRAHKSKREDDIELNEGGE